MKGRYKLSLSENGNVVSETPWIHNLIMESPTTGIGLIMQSLVGGALPLPITSLEIGTGSTAPNITDTGLVTLTLAGVSVRTASATATTALFSFFIPDIDLPNGTYRELLLRSGTQIFARSLISPVFTKSAGQDVIISYEILKT